MGYDDYGAMSRGMYDRDSSAPSVEKPIVPIHQIGVTVPELDPSGRFKNIVQSVQAALRGGAGKLQLVLMHSRNNPIGGAPKAMGKDVREALRELMLANQAEIEGVELPTGSLSNLSGLDLQQGVINEQTRARELAEVRDAIKFTADVAGGGGVDIWSQEFPRQFAEEKWNKDKDGKKIFEIPGEKDHPETYFVDQDTGAIQRLPREGIPVHEKDKDGKSITRFRNLKQFEEKVLEDPKMKHLKSGSDELKLAAFDMFKKAMFSEQLRSSESMKNHHERYIEQYKDEAAMFNKIKMSNLKIPNPDPMIDAERKERLERLERMGIKTDEDVRKKIEQIQERLEREEQALSAQDLTIAKNERLIAQLQPLDLLAKKNAIKSYADAGIMAMQETKNNRNIKKDVTVGPELGWPAQFGGHPDEFIELIQKSRNEMAERLVKQGMSKNEASATAQKHIAGTFDTGHMGMWFEHFKPEEQDYDKRLKEFKGWYGEQVDKLIKANVVGSIQAVDSMSGAHAHLPAGQGILPVKEAVEKFVKAGFTGFIVSEGHEEEKFGEGRILMQTWKEFNPGLWNSYGGGAEGVMASRGYMSQSYSPRKMFGSYTPPFAEYKPWSEIPFE